MEGESISWTCELYFKAWQRQVQRRCNELRNTVLLNNKKVKGEESFEKDIDDTSESKGSQSEEILSSIDVLLNAEQENGVDSFEENIEEDIQATSQNLAFFSMMHNFP